MKQIIRHPIVIAVLSAVLSLVVAKISYDWIIAPFPKSIGDWNIERRSDRHIVASIGSEPLAFVLAQGRKIKPGLNDPSIMPEIRLLSSTLMIICDKNDIRVELAIKEDTDIKDGSIYFKSWYKFDGLAIRNPDKREYIAWNAKKNRLFMNNHSLIEKIGQNQRQYLFFWINDGWYPATGFRLSHSKEVIEIINDCSGR